MPAVLFTACLAIYAIWARRFSRRLKVDAYADAAGRAETLRRFRIPGFLAGTAQTVILIGSIAMGTARANFLPVLAVYLVAVLAQGQIAFSVERRIRGVQAGQLEMLGQAARALAGTLGMYFLYYAVVHGAGDAAGWIARGLSLSPGAQDAISWITIPGSVLLGLVAIALSAPLLIRLMMPCSPVTDPAVIEILERCFRRAGLEIPAFWTIGIDRFKSHNAMVAGLRWGRGWFRPALFFTRSLLEQLTPEEFEAVMLHEVSHVALRHVSKRIYAGVGAFLLVTFPYLLLVLMSVAWLPGSWVISGVIASLLLNLLAQIQLTRIVVRRQELEADENAVRLGASVEAMCGALVKLTTMNDQVTTRKDPSTLLNAGAAHPVTEERVAILRDRVARGFPPRETLWTESVVRPLRRRARILVPAAAAAGCAIVAVLAIFVIPQRALFNAVSEGDLPEVRRLVDSGSSVESRSPLDRSTPLIAAAEDGRLEVLAFLLERGAKVDTPNADGRTALQFAARMGHEAVARALLEHGAKVDQRDRHRSTALTLAAEAGHARVVRLLLEKGADLNAKDGDGDTSLGMAAHHGHAGVVRALTDAGAKDHGRRRSVAGH